MSLFRFTFSFGCMHTSAGGEFELFSLLRFSLIPTINKAKQMLEPKTHPWRPDATSVFTCIYVDSHASWQISLSLVPNGFTARGAQGALCRRMSDGECTWGLRRCLWCACGAMGLWFCSSRKQCLSLILLKVLDRLLRKTRAEIQI